MNDLRPKCPATSWRSPRAAGSVTNWPTRNSPERCTIFSSWSCSSTPPSGRPGLRSEQRRRYRAGNRRPSSARSDGVRSLPRREVCRPFTLDNPAMETGGAQAQSGHSAGNAFIGGAIAFYTRFDTVTLGVTTTRWRSCATPWWCFIVAAVVITIESPSELSPTGPSSRGSTRSSAGVPANFSESHRADRSGASWPLLFHRHRHGRSGSHPGRILLRPAW